MRHLMLAGSFLGIFAFLSFGCSSGPAPIVLKYSTWGSTEARDIFKSAGDQFHKLHPEVKLELEQIPYGEYVTKILTQYAAGASPDVMLVDNDQVAGVSTRGVFVDLDPYIAKDPDLHIKDFYPEAIRQFSRDGSLLVMPLGIAPVAVIYYNKKAFDEAGLPYPKNDWDYLEFLKVARKLVKKDANRKTVRFGFVDERNYWQTWAFDFGGSLVNDPWHPTRCTADKPADIAGVQFRADLILKYGVMPGPADQKAMGYEIGNSDFFINGQVAMFHSGVWNIPFFRKVIKNFDWDVVQFPKGPHGRRRTELNAAGYGILKSTKHPDLAYDLVRCLAGVEGQQHLAASGLGMPALKAVAHSKYFLDGQKPKSKAFLVDAVKEGTFIALHPRLNEWQDLLLSYLDRVWTGEEKPEIALKKATVDVNNKFFSTVEPKN
jgi:ABC-type glycerol-3-phosphate transport system substrate-binding protein